MIKNLQKIGGIAALGHTGSLTLHNFGVVANLYGSVPAQAAAWTALMRSLWVLLLSLAAVRTGGLTRATGYLGVFLGIAGILTMIPALAEIMFMIFGPGMMVWSAWVGTVMLRRSPVSAAQKTTTEQQPFRLQDSTASRSIGEVLVPADAPDVK